MPSCSNRVGHDWLQTGSRKHGVDNWSVWWASAWKSLSNYTPESIDAKEVSTSRRTAPFFVKTSHQVEQAKRPTRVGKVEELMEVDWKNLLHTMRSDKLDQEDVYIPFVCRLVQFCTNPDKIIHATSVENPRSLNGMLLPSMDLNEKAFNNWRIYW